MSAPSIKATGIAAANRALSPKASHKKPTKASRPKSSSRTSSEDSIAPAAAPSKDKTPLRATETVYYDAPGKVEAPPRSAASALLTSLPQDDIPGTALSKVAVASSTQPVARQVVTITLSKPNVKPPVYIASSMSDWRVDEMAYEVEQSGDGGQYMFYMGYEEVKPGQHMYRFKPAGHKDWIVDDASPTATNETGQEHNIITVESRRTESVQIPHGSNVMLAKTVDINPSTSTAAQLTAAATDLLQTRADDVPPPSDEFHFSSEIAVSPPANDSLHQHGILGEVIETALATAGPPEVKPIPKTTSDSYASNQSTIPDTADMSSGTPFPLVPAPTHAGTQEYDLGGNDAKQVDLEQVNKKLDTLPRAIDTIVPPLQEPADVAAELGTVEEELDEAPVLVNADDKADQDQGGRDLKARVMEWLAVGTCLTAGAIAGVVVGVLVLQFMDGPDLSPIEAP